MKKITLNKTALTSWICLLYPMLILSYGKGYNLAAAVIAIPAVIFAFTTPKKIFTKEVWQIIAIYGLFFLSFALPLLVSGESGRVLDKPSRFIAAILILLMLIRFPPKLNWLFNGFAIGGIISGISAFITMFIFHQERALTNGDNFFLKGFQPIQAGDIALTLGFLSLCGCFYYIKCKQRNWALLSLVGFLMGLLASILSGSRGGWIAVPFILAYLIWTNRQQLKMKYMALGTVIVIAISALFGGTLIHKIEKRLDATMTEYEMIAEDNNTSSVGVRFVLWKDAWLTIKEHPVFGVSRETRDAMRAQHLKNGKIELPKWAQETLMESHSHNEYINAWVLRGVPGIFTLLLLFLGPAYLFHKQQNNSVQSQTIKQMGYSVIGLTMMYGLSQVFFAHMSGIVFYFVIMAILLSQNIVLKER